MNTKPILIGTHYHPGTAETLGRQERARQSLAELSDVRLVNLQFHDAATDVAGFRTVPRLFEDSIKATGRQGTRKPIGSEAFQRLAECARDEGCEFFGWVNSDVIVTPTALELVRSKGQDAVLFSRMDFDPATGADLGIETGGIDAFFFSVAWWEAHATLFRPYVNSEAFWDPVYAAIALCRGRAFLENHMGLIRHEAHLKAWKDSPFAAYNQNLATLDSLYLNQWLRYRDRLREMRAAGCTLEDELGWQFEAFRWPPSLVSRLWPAGRCLKARIWDRIGRRC